jgi:hypothetical protein
MPETYLEAFIAQVYQNVSAFYTCAIAARWYALQFNRPTPTIPFEDVVVGAGEKVRLIVSSECYAYSNPTQRMKIQRSPANQNVWTDVGTYAETTPNLEYLHTQLSRLDQPGAGTYDYRLLVCTPAGNADRAMIWDPVNYPTLHFCDFYLQVFGAGAGGKVEARIGVKT